MKKSLISLTQSIKVTLALLCLVLISQVSYSQDPGGNPDGPPPAVPLDDYLLLILAAVGILVAFFFFKKRVPQNVSR